MNKVILMGRLTRDPVIRYSNSENPIAVANYTLAVDRKYKRQGDDQTADFIRCVAFGKNAEFAERYLRQGTKITASGRIQTGSYTDKEGKRIFTTNVIIEEQEFAESKRVAEHNANAGYAASAQAASDGFIKIPEGLEEELPFV